MAALLAVGSTNALAAEGTCPAFLEGARSLVVVTARSMNATSARLRLFQRNGPSNAWRPIGASESAVLGATGLAWGHPFRGMARAGEPVKAEGDRRTPIGIYRFGRSFGFHASGLSGQLVLRPGESICVDDPASTAYNTIVLPRSGTRPRGEDMGAQPLYRRGLVIDYPSDAGRRAGSCIFLHVWRGPGRGTAGCVALPETRVAALQAIAGRGETAIAILPEGALDRFSGCLPGVGAGR